MRRMDATRRGLLLMLALVAAALAGCATPEEAGPVVSEPSPPAGEPGTPGTPGAPAQRGDHNWPNDDASPGAPAQHAEEANQTTADGGGSP